MENRPTLNKSLEIARQVEKALRDAKSLSSFSNDSTVNSIKFKQSTKFQFRSTNDKSCFRCGSKFHLANNPNCKAKRATCRKCRKVGHFEKVCKSASVKHIDHSKDNANAVLTVNISTTVLEMVFMQNCA